VLNKAKIFGLKKFLFISGYFTGRRAKQFSFTSAKSKRHEALQKKRRVKNTNIQNINESFARRRCLHQCC
jgi:hypothetical protein